MKPLSSLTDDEFGHLAQRAVRELPDAPPALQRAALALWPAPGPAAALQALAQGLVTHIVAVLSFDSWAAPALAAGMRSVRSPTRHLLYSAQGRDIDLRISPPAPMHTLSGQVLGPDETGSVELLLQAGGAVPASTALDALGEFRFEGLHRGSYVMTLQLGSDRIVLPPVEVGEPAA